MGKILRFVTAIACLSGVSAAAHAATQGVTFNGHIDAACVLTIGSNGTMTAGTDLKTLSSHNAGGSAGIVDLSTTGGVTLSVDAAVTGLLVPGTDTTPTTWTPTFSTAGTHNFGEGTASRALATPGASTVTVHLGGVKAGANTFTGGDYEATVTVRCEP